MNSVLGSRDATRPAIGTPPAIVIDMPKLPVSAPDSQRQNWTTSGASSPQRLWNAAIASGVA